MTTSPGSGSPGSGSTGYDSPSPPASSLGAPTRRPSTSNVGWQHAATRADWRRASGATDRASAELDTDLGAHRQNVGRGERWTSLAAGSILAGLGAARRDLTGGLVALAGGALLYRGATGRCPAYRALGVDTAGEGEKGLLRSRRGKRDDAALREHGIHVAQAFTIDKPAAELYRFWRRFDELPQILSHVERVEVLDGGRSRWTVRAPRLVGGKVEWEAEITRDEPDTRIEWRSLPGADVRNTGSVRFEGSARGTIVHVELSYMPPAGRVGRWFATLFGADPEHLIREDLRNFKRVIETGDILTTKGQPRGTCTGSGKREA